MVFQHDALVREHLRPLVPANLSQIYSNVVVCLYPRIPQIHYFPDKKKYPKLDIKLNILFKFCYILQI
jgi:hypothetical protein